MSFEEVALKFLDVNERDALRSYLISRLERTRKGVSGPFNRLRYLSFLTRYTGPNPTTDACNMARRVLLEQVERDGRPHRVGVCLAGPCLSLFRRYDVLTRSVVCRESKFRAGTA